MKWKIVIGACVFGLFLVTACGSKQDRQVKFEVNQKDGETQLKVEETQAGVTTTKTYSGERAKDKIKECLNDANDAIKRAAEEANEKLKEASEKVGEAAEKTGDKIEKGVDKAGKKMKEAWDDTKEGVQKATEKKKEN